MTEKKNEGMQTSTKIMTYIAGAVLTLTVLSGIVMGLGTMGGEESYEAQTQSYNNSSSPF